MYTYFCYIYSFSTQQDISVLIATDAQISDTPVSSKQRNKTHCLNNKGGGVGMRTTAWAEYSASDVVEDFQLQLFPKALLTISHILLNFHLLTLERLHTHTHTHTHTTQTYIKFYLYKNTWHTHTGRAAEFNKNLDYSIVANEPAFLTDERLPQTTQLNHYYIKQGTA